MDPADDSARAIGKKIEEIEPEKAFEALFPEHLFPKRVPPIVPASPRPGEARMKSQGALPIDDFVAVMMKKPKPEAGFGRLRLDSELESIGISCPYHAARAGVYLAVIAAERGRLGDFGEAKHKRKILDKGPGEGRSILDRFEELVNALGSSVMPYEQRGTARCDQSEIVARDAEVTSLLELIESAIDIARGSFDRLCKRADDELARLPRGLHGSAIKTEWGVTFAEQMGFLWKDLTGKDPATAGGSRLKAGDDTDMRSGFALFVEYGYASALGLEAKEFEKGGFAVANVVKKAVKRIRSRPSDDRWDRDDPHWLQRRYDAIITAPPALALAGTPLADPESAPRLLSEARRQTAHNPAWRKQIISEVRRIATAAERDKTRHPWVIQLEKMRIATQIENWRRVPEFREFVEDVINGEPQRLEVLDRQISVRWRYGGLLARKLGQLKAAVLPPAMIADLEERQRENYELRRKLMSDWQILRERCIRLHYLLEPSMPERKLSSLPRFRSGRLPSQAVLFSLS